MNKELKQSHLEKLEVEAQLLETVNRMCMYLAWVQYLPHVCSYIIIILFFSYSERKAENF